MPEQEHPKIIGIERGITIRMQKGVERVLKEMTELEALMKDTSEQLRIAMKLNGQGIDNNQEIELLLHELKKMEDSWDALQAHAERGVALLNEETQKITEFLREKEKEPPHQE